MVKAFVINLDKDIERMEFMARQLTALGIPYERYPAVRPEQVGPEEHDASAASTQGGHTLIPGELGCAASHKRVYETILAQGLEYALVLEDDVELPLNFASIIEREVMRNRGRWEYLLFDYWQPGPVFIRRWFASVLVTLRLASKKGTPQLILLAVYSLLKSFYVVPLSLLEGLRDVYKKRLPGPVSFYRPLYLAGAYLVTSAGARKLLSLATPIIYTADKLPNQARVRSSLKFYAYAPLSVRQRKEEFGSSILGLPGNAL